MRLGLEPDPLFHGASCSSEWANKLLKNPLQTSARYRTLPHTYTLFTWANILFYSVSKGDAPAVYITAVLDDTCVTISGRPDILEEFASFNSGRFATHRTTLDTLYHSPIHAPTTRRQILADVVRRNIAFPDFSDILVPIRSTLTGKPLSKEIVSGSLVEVVVDMVITEPVNWDLLMSELVQALPAHASACLLNFGPGAGLIRSMERSFPTGRISHHDISLPSEEPNKVKPKQEPIAIVGMAVNMPGARNTSKLWEVLEKGINTISEVSLFQRSFERSELIPYLTGSRT